MKLLAVAVARWDLARLMRAIVAAVIAVMPAAAWPLDFYGIEIGKPMTYPECATRTIGVTTLYPFPFPTEEPCFMDVTKPGRPVSDGMVNVRWPLERGPKYAAGEIYARIKGGIVQRVSMSTDGAATQQDLFAELTRKFGKPQVNERHAVRTALGAKYTAIKAGWVTGDYVVVFEGIGFTVDGGSLEVYTRAAWDAEKADERKNETKRPRM